MKEKFMFSSFVQLFKRNGVVAIFHALSREIVFVNEANLVEIRNILSGAPIAGFLDETVDYLKQKRFIVDVDTDEMESLKLIQQSILQNPCIDTLYLLLTDNCNFACTYCFFEGSYNGPKEKITNMTSELAISSVRRFASYLKKAYESADFIPYEPSVVFYGGEPLINADTFFVAVEEIVSLKGSGAIPQNLTINVNTNGSLVSREIASFCVKHNIEVDVSLDGYKSAHDACRVWRGGTKGTFMDVMKGITIRRVGEFLNPQHIRFNFKC